MRKLLSWRVLFGFMVVFTVIIVSLMLFSILQERSRVHKIFRELIGSVKNVDSTNRATSVVIDSLANRLSYLSSQVTMLEAQKDSLIGSQVHSKKGGLNNINTTQLDNSNPLGRPVFKVVGRNGKTIGNDGISLDSVVGTRVEAGKGYLIKEMDVVTGTVLMRKVVGVSGNYDWGHLVYAIGDRVIISIKRVVRLTPRGTGENVEVGTVVLTIPIRATRRPYLSIRQSETGEVVNLNGIKASLVSGFVVVAGSGYEVKNMELTLARGTNLIVKMIVKSNKADIKDWATLVRPGDRIVIDVTNVTLKGPTGREKNFRGDIISIPIL